MNKETFEEAAEKEYPTEGEDSIYCDLSIVQQCAFKAGAKWQQERSYSEIEDFINWIDEEEIPREDGVWIKYFDGKDNYLTTKELFEQFKKK